MPIILTKVTATCKIHSHCPILSSSHSLSMVVYHPLPIQIMLKNKSPPKRANITPLCGLFGSQQCCDDLLESLDNCLQTATSKDCGSGKHTNQYHLQHGYGYSPSQQQFPGSLLFYHQSLFDMTHSSPPTTSTSQGLPSYRPQWQGYDLHRGSFSGSRIYPPWQLSGQGPSSPGAQRVLPEYPENNPVNRPTSSSCTPPPEHPSGTPERLPISLPRKRFQLPAEQWKPDGAGIMNLPPVQEISNDECEADDERDDSSNLGSAEGKPPISLMETEFFLQQFATRMG